MSRSIEPLRARLIAAAIAGLVAGSVDIVVATAINGVPPSLILRSIASGLLGLRAYTESSWIVLFGLVVQLVMSVLIAGIFSLATLRLSWLLTRPILAGIAYGCAVFVVMNVVVVPLSAFAPRPAHISPAYVVENVAAMLLFGLIVALVTRSIIHRELRSS